MLNPIPLPWPDWLAWIHSDLHQLLSNRPVAAAGTFPRERGQMCHYLEETTSLPVAPLRCSRDHVGPAASAQHGGG